jgi:hypothetical protein
MPVRSGIGRFTSASRVASGAADTATDAVTKRATIVAWDNAINLPRRLAMSYEL